MLTTRIIPCLDVTDGQVVKGIKFAGLRAVGSPADLALLYEQQGADEIVILDITATSRNQKTQLETVESVRNVLSIPLTVGGGVRTIEDVQRLTDAGADRVSINSAAVDNPELVTEINERFGQQCTVVAIDARQVEAEQNFGSSKWQVITHSGTRNAALDVLAWAAQVESLGAGEILLTSFDRDGTRSGYDCDLIQAVTGMISIPVIASGGADNAGHLFEGVESGAAAVLLASILHDQITTVQKLKTELTQMGIPIRNVDTID